MPPPDTHSRPDSPDRVSETRPETPERTRRRNRLETLSFPPDRSGMSRQGDPVRNRQRTASTKGRLSAAVAPGSVALPGSVSPVRARIPSVSTVLSAFTVPLAHAVVACRAVVPAVIGGENGIKPGDSQDDCQRALDGSGRFRHHDAAGFSTPWLMDWAELRPRSWCLGRCLLCARRWGEQVLRSPIWT